MSAFPLCRVLGTSASVARVGTHLIRLADRLQAEYPTTSVAVVMRSIEAARRASSDSLPDVDRYLRLVDHRSRIELATQRLVGAAGTHR